MTLKDLRQEENVENFNIETLILSAVLTCPVWPTLTNAQTGLKAPVPQTSK